MADADAGHRRRRCTPAHTRLFEELTGIGLATPDGMTLFGYHVGPLLKRTGREILADDVPGLAAGTAYNFFLSIFPLLLFLAPLLGLVGDKQQTMLTLLGWLSGSLPPAALTLFRDILEDVVFSENAPGLMSIGAVGALWAGSNIFTTLISALNRAFDVEENRSWVKRRLLSIAAAVGTGVILFSTTLILLAGEWLAERLGGPDARTLLLVLQVPAAAAILTLLAALNFRFLPAVRIRWSHAFAGGVLTVVLWLAVTMLFRLYVQNFGSYNKTYGTIGGVIVLLTWMYLSMLAVLTGGELASELHQGTGASPSAGPLVDARSGRLGHTPAFALSSTDRRDRLDPLAPDAP